MFNNQLVIRVRNCHFEKKFKLKIIFIAKALKMIFNSSKRNEVESGSKIYVSKISQEARSVEILSFLIL